MIDLEILASVSAILTAVVALLGYGLYQWDQHRKKKVLIDLDNVR